jgi:hypothetical protein
MYCKLSVIITEKDECFEIEISDPEGGASLGRIRKTAVTIANDDGKLCSDCFSCLIVFI